LNALPGDPEVVVIGAGAAGIGASLGLSQLGVSHVVLEAKDRVGGRAFSESSSLGHLWDHGCHWMHSADVNVLREMADKLGHRYLARTAGAFASTFTNGAWAPSSVRSDYLWAFLDEVAEVGRRGSDIAASTLLDPGHPYHAVARHWLKLMYSAEPENISTRDAGNYTDTGVHYPVEDGYGALVAKMARNLPIRLSTPVQSLEVTREHVRVITPSGTLLARAVILAVPARMIEKGLISFCPGLPDELAEAFAEIPMGWYEKIAIGFDQRVFEEKIATYADIVAADSTPLNFELHPFGRPIAITHIAGNQARDMESTGEQGMVDFALNALVAAFGSDIRQHVVRGTTTHWSSDSFVNGAYACAKPGKAELRKRFSMAIHDRIFLAGEHVHLSFNATAHGAYDTGLEAASRVAALMGKPAILSDRLWLPL
jgi:monoamine oxidase